MRTTISSKGQVVLPAALRQKDDLQVGTQFEIRRKQNGEYLLKRIAPSANEGFVDWLLSCPEKGFLEQAENRGTTDDIQPDFA